MTPHSFKYQLGRGRYIDSLKAALHILVSVPLFTFKLPFYIWARYHAIYAEHGVKPRLFREGIQLVLITLLSWLAICTVLPIVGICGFLRPTR